MAEPVTVGAAATGAGAASGFEIAGALGLGSMMFDQFFNFRNANRNFDLQRKAYLEQKRMNRLAQHNYENAVQIRANDYEKAGFNRLLAANGGVGSGPVGHVGNPAQMNYTSNIADKLMAYKNLKLLDQQMKMQEQQIELMKANKASVEADIDIKKNEAVLRKNEADSSNFGIDKDSPYWLRLIQRNLSSGNVKKFFQGSFNYGRNLSEGGGLAVKSAESDFREYLINSRNFLFENKQRYLSLISSKFSGLSKDDYRFMKDYAFTLAKYKRSKIYGYVRFPGFMIREGRKYFDFSLRGKEVKK